MSEKVPERWWITPMAGCIPENVYQAFKARLMKELASVDTVQTLYGEGERYPQLIENPASDHLDQ